MDLNKLKVQPKDEHRYDIVTETEVVAEYLTKKDADEIVKACRAHKGLVKACKWIYDHLDCKDTWVAIRNVPGAEEWVDGLKAALAEGESK